MSGDMSMLTTIYLMERYGPLLTEDEVGEALNISGKTVRNQRAQGRFPIPTAEGASGIQFHAADVAEHIDSMRAAVKSASFERLSA